jgi:hypothetical protein
MLYTINVTEEDILHGARSNCMDCPVARAMQRVIGKPIKVGLSRIYVDYDRDTMTVVPLNDEVSRFIHNFDRFYSVEPFSFQIEL